LSARRYRLKSPEGLIPRVGAAENNTNKIKAQLLSSGKRLLPQNTASRGTAALCL
jgi:hypothetical protein